MPQASSSTTSSIINYESVYESLFSFCQEGHLEKMKDLLQNIDGLDINRADKFGKTVFHWACFRGHEEIVKWLMAYPDINLWALDNAKQSPLFWACIKEQFHIAEIILQQEARAENINQINTVGQTAFYIACLKNNIELIRFFLSKPQLNPDIADADGMTPLLWASANGFEEVVSLLIQRQDVDLNHVNKRGDTALLLACKRNRPNVVELLCAQPTVNINQKDGQGKTGLHIACIYNHISLVSFFLNRQDFLCANEQDEENKTPLQTAFLASNFALTKRLLCEPRIDLAGLQSNWGYRFTAFLDSIEATSLKDKIDLAVMFYALGLKPENETSAYFQRWLNYLEQAPEQYKKEVQYIRNMQGIKSLRGLCLYSVFNHQLIQKWHPSEFFLNEISGLVRIVQSFTDWNRAMDSAASCSNSI